MIEPMRLLTLIVPEADRVSAVERLRDLGVMQVETSSVQETPELSALTAALEEADRVVDILQVSPESDEALPDAADGAQVVRMVQDSLKLELDLQRELDQCCTRIAQAAPWGRFSTELLDRAGKFGLRIYCCTAPKKVMAELSKKYVCMPLSGSGAAMRFAVLADADIAPEELPLAELPAGTCLAKLEEQAADLRQRMAENRLFRSALKGHLEMLRQYRANLAAELEFAQVRLSVGVHDKLATITGFVPEILLDPIREAVKKFGWGFADRPADPAKESVPTLLKMPKMAKVITPLMDFLAISPGYDERDVSLPVLFFFTVFFGMLVGDAGYGTLFLIGAVIGWLTVGREKVSARLPLLLLTLLSCAAIGWGWASGNCFGMSIPGIPWLSSDPQAGRNTQLVCFTLALAQLALAHIFRILDGGVRNVLGQVGWILVLTANYLLVYMLLLTTSALPGWFLPAMLSCYGAGIVLAAIAEINIRDVGSMFGFPFSIISSFVDVLSYIRLFAVGMSGFYLAKCFNDMAMTLRGVSDWMLPVSIFVLLFGHILNIALASMGVLVHGVRLNTLEFSSHLGLRWGGTVFSPFRRHDK